MTTSRKTKLICTLGPTAQEPETIAELIRGGANVFRVNMSHAPHDWARKVVATVREEADKQSIKIGVLFDLAGPSIRTGVLETPIKLELGDQMEFRKFVAAPNIMNSTTVNYDDMMNDVETGKELVVDNGVMVMDIVEKQDDRILCIAKSAGILGSRRHINLPGVRLNLPALSEKDHKDIVVAIECEADFIAGSFVRDGAHVRELRQLMESLGGKAHIVSKVEDQEAVKNIDEIIKETDVIMVARGDLGTEVPYEELPILQRKIVKRCHELGRRVIVATQMLESMIVNPNPTRAEVTDVANAAYEEADSVMLSGETASGRFPVRAGEAIDRIVRRTERSGGIGYGQDVELKTERQKVARAAINLVDSLENACLVIQTRRGVYANEVAMMRPKTNAFYAFTPDESICRKLTLTRGLQSFAIEFKADIRNTQQDIINYLIDNKVVASGTTVVFVTDLGSKEIEANSIMLYRA